MPLSTAHPTWANCEALGSAVRSVVRRGRAGPGDSWRFEGALCLAIRHGRRGLGDRGDLGRPVPGRSPRSPWSWGSWRFGAPGAWPFATVVVVLGIVVIWGALCPAVRHGRRGLGDRGEFAVGNGVGFAVVGCGAEVGNGRVWSLAAVGVGPASGRIRCPVVFASPRARCRGARPGPMAAAPHVRPVVWNIDGAIAPVILHLSGVVVMLPSTAHSTCATWANCASFGALGSAVRQVVRRGRAGSGDCGEFGAPCARPFATVAVVLGIVANARWATTLGSSWWWVRGPLSGTAGSGHSPRSGWSCLGANSMARWCFASPRARCRGARPAPMAAPHAHPVAWNIDGVIAPVILHLSGGRRIAVPRPTRHARRGWDCGELRGAGRRRAPGGSPWSGRFWGLWRFRAPGARPFARSPWSRGLWRVRGGQRCRGSPWRSRRRERAGSGHSPRSGGPASGRIRCLVVSASPRARCRGARPGPMAAPHAHPVRWNIDGAIAPVILHLSGVVVMLLSTAHPTWANCANYEALGSAVHPVVRRGRAGPGDCERPVPGHSPRSPWSWGSWRGCGGKRCWVRRGGVRRAAPW